MKKIDIIIYSKDRPTQLDLLLRSIKDKLINVGRVNVLWDYSDGQYRLGYMKLFNKNYGLNIRYIFQDCYEYTNTFEKWTRYIIDNLMTDYYLGLCDDDVFIRETDCSDILLKLEEEDINAISLKAGLNIIGNHPNFIYSHPNFIETQPYLKWEWRLSDSNSDWGYPTCINSYIFKKDYYIELLNRIHFNRPTTMEGGLNSIKSSLKRYMYSFREQKILNIISNRVQNVCLNRVASNYYYSTEDLNKKFLDGYIISTKNIYDIKATMGNDEVEFLWIKE